MLCVPGVRGRVEGAGSSHMTSEYRKPIDDRGRVLSAVFVEDADALDDSPHLSKDAIRRVRRAVGADSVFTRSIAPRFILVLLTIFASAGAVNAVLTASGWNWWGWPQTGQTAVLAVVSGCIAYLCRFLPVRAHRGVLRAVVNEGLCAGCGYRIDGLPAEPDGCTVCPECGAAWKLPSPGATNDPSTPT